MCTDISSKHQGVCVKSSKKIPLIHDDLIVQAGLRDPGDMQL